MLLDKRTYMALPDPSPQNRNLPLDFFRGLALIVIFINHMPDNPWFWYTPSRFGLSDAAEVFVFSSGFASARAYGRCFERAGLWLGLVRVLHRCVQIYSAHLASFVLLALVCVVGNRWVPEMDDIQRLNIAYFFDATQQALYDLFTLAYVPNYFDILPLYLLVIVWLPIFWLVSRLHVGMAFACSVTLYWASYYYGWELSADPVSGRKWYFNPYNWQLMFFTGYAFGAGWAKVSVKHGWLLAVCLGLVLVSIPLEHEATYTRIKFWGELRANLTPWLDKSHLGVLRWLHLLALAYLMYRLCHWRSQWLHSPVPRAVVIMGQQSLPIYLCSMVLSYAGGIWLDHLGRDEWSAAALVNLSGLGLMLLAGQTMSWLDTKPWKVSQPERLAQSDNSYYFEPFMPRYRWVNQALALPCLIGIAALPAMLTHSQPSGIVATPDLAVQLREPDKEALQPVETLSPETEADKVIDSRQQL
ncbi:MULTISPECIES: OpgC family protein [unclassified Methylomonas]|uniref:OpgC family protein n=1 Tax=unclassified Methylomonas TaxID=2608980 RepID=UPI001CEC8AA5|nr:OpgC domain-containing protein [Methylomonas sp. LW13]